MSDTVHGGWTAAFAWALLTAVLLLLPAAALPSTPFWMPSTFNGWIDCIVHGALFFVLAYLTLRADGRRESPAAGRQSRLLALVLLYAMLLELLQVPVPGRSLQIVDVVFAALGIGCAWLLFLRSRESSS